MKLHYVYYAIKKDGTPKVGATQNIIFRPRLGKYKETIILEAYECPWKCGDREIELQLQYFGKRDSKIHYADSIKSIEKRVAKAKETRKKNKTKIKITTKDIKRGNKTYFKNLEKQSYIFRGKDNGYTPPKLHKDYKSVGTNHQDSKLNENTVREIRKKFDKDKDVYSTFCKHYNVTANTIRKVVLGITWKHIK